MKFIDGKGFLFGSHVQIFDLLILILAFVFFVGLVRFHKQNPSESVCKNVIKCEASSCPPSCAAQSEVEHFDRILKEEKKILETEKQKLEVQKQAISDKKKELNKLIKATEQELIYKLYSDKRLILLLN